MAKAVSYACFKYLDDQIRYYYEPIESIFYKKNDKSHIRPKDLSNFEKNHKYYVLWQPIYKVQVLSTRSKIENKQPVFYPGYIVCLGVSENDARIRAINKPKRLVVPKLLTSSDSNEHESETNKVKPQTNKIIKNIVQRVNSQRTIDKFKQSTLLKNREESLDSLRNDCMSEDDAQDIENDSTVDNNAKKMQTMQITSQRERRVVLQDCLKEKENREMRYLNVKIIDETKHNLEYCMSLPACSTPKRKMEKFYSFQEHHSINFLRHSYPYMHRTLQAEISRPQKLKDRQHISLVARDTNLDLAISQLSPVIAGSQLMQSQRLRRSEYQTTRRSDLQISVDSEIRSSRVLLRLLH
ncbi:uncharacterized protein LOC100679273 [Nasonia vitripennis]|uniref:Uncharacterized protein n=1 Tax=Nasonia vitripennis TaxID=7425 RepID=A0A7M7T7T3_NASVI|nr:uncharacterized protein LOC100679273 [Nasonia vitripennis]